MRTSGTVKVLSTAVFLFLAVAADSPALASMGVVESAALTNRADVRLSGAGATFPAPLYKRWVVEFEKALPIAKIDYNSIGSGGGVKAITDKIVAFGASDAPLTKKEIEALGGAGKLVQVPSCAGAVVPAYNVPGVKEPLNFSGEVLAKIFAGTISKWNDPALQALNPGVDLPAITITPAYRSDGSGTTFVFSSFLCTQSAEFKSSIGSGKQVKWPVGQGGKGNEGVSAIIQQTTGALGYIEANYATATQISFGNVKNVAGAFMRATPESVAAAGLAGVEAMKGTSVLAADIWNQPGEGVYPISAFTYFIVYKDLDNLKSIEEAQALVKFMHWATSDGQRFAKEMDYAPLAPAVQARVREALSGITFRGKPIEAR